MFRLLSIASFGCSVGMYVWGNADRLWTWPLMALIGLLCLAISTKWDTD